MTTFTSVQDGDWSAGETWGNGSGGDYPAKTTSGDIVNIDHNVIYDIDNSASGLNHMLAYIDIDSSKKLDFATDQDTYMWIGNGTSDCINMNYASEFNIGTSVSPLSSSYTCTIETDQTSDGSGNTIDLGNDSYVQIYGAEKTIRGETTSTLTANSSTTFTMTSIPSDWAVDDELVIQGTDSDRSNHYEDEVTITNISGTTITFEGDGTGNAVVYDHTSGCIVLNLTRNIKFISPDTSSRPRCNIEGENARAHIEYIDFNSSSDGDHYGAWALSTSTSSARFVEVKGCVTRNQGNDGAGAQNSGYKTFEDCIFYANSDKGFSGQNDVGKMYMKNCYFVHNNSAGLSISNRGSIYLENCYVWGNSSGISAGVDTLMIGGYIFNNGDAGVSTGYGDHKFIGVHFGESEVATQNNYSGIKCQYAPSFCDDCSFADSNPFQTQNNGDILAYSSNHNQVGDAYFVDSRFSNTSMEDDTTTYRTTSPSVKLIPGYDALYLQYKIPVRVESGTSYTITIYGKKNATGSRMMPTAKILGCGIEDSATWSTEDTNWNSITLGGTASRNGTATIVITAWGEQFNIDDITIA